MDLKGRECNQTTLFTCNVFSKKYFYQMSFERDDYFSRTVTGPDVQKATLPDG